MIELEIAGQAGLRHFVLHKWTGRIYLRAQRRQFRLWDLLEIDYRGSED
jgi:hypothetical protein